MPEQDIEIVENDGFKNIYLKPKDDVIKGLTYENYIIVEKLFAEAREVQGKYGPFYSAMVRYKDEDVSFIMNEKEHKQFKDIGGIGDRIKVTCFEHKFKFGAMNGTTPRLKFELIE